jgi:hypothetical protein
MAGRQCNQFIAPSNNLVSMSKDFDLVIFIPSTPLGQTKRDKKGRTSANIFR